ncbi:NUDIX domain-containing protein [Enterovibrio paralichthyis]|uniref:NUDIX domain-containing protein n=1 Tax=Enterovibrio paralichthyis TaxID=2853805 RepID=UPI001C48AF25|nr:NUDIX hydrolase [Enterovibrio paralichthyis]MBV7296559.1 NUDIX domain-containing protein [Enterovibrio paralichthyis]
MQVLHTSTHASVLPLEDKRTFFRRAARGIIVRERDILLLYTERYHDYSLPGGGIDEGEDEMAGLIRELSEETGAQNIRNIRPFGAYEEFRPWYKDDFDAVHMMSYCYWCDIDEELGELALEDYEVKNGMRPVWINIDDAIQHNKEALANSDKQGLSLEREIFLLERIAAVLSVESEQVA